jgi:hypothetical protein
MVTLTPDFASKQGWAPRGRLVLRVRTMVGLMTREYPPHVYGGAGVHVEYLSRELAKLIEVEVHCWGHAAVDEGNLHVRGAMSRRRR